MKKSVKRNYAYNLLYQILAVVLPMLTTPYIARVLGASGTGTYSYTISIVTYFTLFGSLGVNLYGQREIAYVQENDQKKNQVFTELFILKTITMSIAMAVFWFLFAMSGQYATYYKILTLEIIANIIDISWVYQGLEEFRKIALRNISIRLMSTILMFALINDSNDVWIYILIYALTTLFGNLSLWFKHKKYIKFDITNLNIKQHIKPAIALFIPQIAIQVYVVLDKTMLGSILNNMNEVGYYEQSQKIIKILLTLITSIGTVMLPRIAKTFADKNHSQIQKYTYQTINYVYTFSIPLMFGIIAVAHNFVPLFFGPGYDEVILIMSMMSIIILFISLSNVVGMQYLLPTKRQKEYTISVVSGALINLVLNFILIYRFEAIGATIATIFAEFSVTTIQLFYIRKDFKLSKILTMSSKYFIAGLSMFLLCLLISFFIENKIVGLITQVVVGAIVYFSMLIILREQFILNTLNNYIFRYIKLIRKGK